MGLLDFLFHKHLQQADETFDLPAIVQRMFDENGITSHREEGMFATVIDGTHTNFKTVLLCVENKGLFIYVPFPIPVPKRLAGLVAHELSRLNDGTHKTEITLQEEGDIYKVVAMIECEFDKEPITNEIKQLMIHTIDLMDSENFCSLACAILGFATYEELQEAMMKCARKDGDKVVMKMSDGYEPLLEYCGEITSSRYAGRLLMFSVHIIRNRLSLELAQKMLTDQTPFLLLMQKAYDVADDEERDVLRKLRFLMLAKSTGEDDNDAENMLGRLEADALIEKDKYSLLRDMCLDCENS